MKILRKDGIYKSGNSLYLSQENPSFSFDSEYELDLISKSDSSDEILYEISNFYNKHNNTNDRYGIIYLMSNNELTNYLNINAHIARIYKERLLGCSISFFIPVKIDTKLDQKSLISPPEYLNSEGLEGSIIIAYCGFLVVDTKYRKKGLGMGIIKKSIQELYNAGGLIAFFVNRTSRCINSIPIKYWYFPINLSKLDTCNFQYPKNYKNLFNIDKPDLEIVKIDEGNLETSWNFYTNLICNKKFAFAPSLNFWSKWIKSFPTYMIKDNLKLVGIFSFKSYYEYHSYTVAIGHTIMCIGRQPDTVKCTLYQSRELYDIIYFNQTGDITKKLLKSVNAQEIYKTDYINFYNTGILLSSSDFYVPLI